MSVLVGSARIDENGNICGGQAGDQTGNEVCTQEWYSKPWDFMAIHPDANVRELHAQAVEQACANDNVGYDQNQRNTLNIQAALVDYIIKNITTKCECDCSSLQNVAAIASGAEKASNYGSNGWTTSNMRSKLKALGYIIITAAEYLKSAAYCVRGAIYVSEGHHTVGGLTNGSSYKKTLEKAGVSTSGSASSGTTSGTTGSTTKKDDDGLFDETLSGTYVVTASSGLNVRYGIDKEVKVAIPKNTEVQNYGYYNEKNGVKWLYIKFKYNGVEYTGYASSEFLSKKSGSSTSSNTGTSKTGSTGSTGSSSSKPNYIVGNTYTLQCNLAVRKSPSKDAALVGYNGLTADGKKHDTDKNGYLEKGTKVTCKSVIQKSSTEKWIKIPSGYMCGYDSSTVYIK